MQKEQELAAALGREDVLKDQLLKEVSGSHERLKKQIQTCGELEVIFRYVMMNVMSRSVAFCSFFLFNNLDRLVCPKFSTMPNI